MSNQKKKRNHWVPQAYLRPFAAEPAEREKIWTLDISDGDPQLRPISKVAVRFYLYAPQGTGGQRDYSFEDKLGSLEQMFGHSGWKAISSGEVDLRSPAIRKGIALTAAVMFLRHPSRFEDWKALHRRMVAFFSSFERLPDHVSLGGDAFELDHSDWAAYSGAYEETLKRMWLDQVGSATSLAKRFMAMRWSVLVADSPAFITSDNPVVPVHESLQFGGFGNPSASILFPLGPTRLLSMDWMHGEPDGAYYAARPETIAACNYLIWRYSETMLTGRHPDEICAELVEHFDREAAA